MKEFNLELAKQGHPLITRDGTKVVNFYCACLELNCNFPVHFILEADLVSRRATSEGQAIYQRSIHNNLITSHVDLFLDDSIPWEPELKMGDIVECLYSNNTWHDRIFIGYATLGEIYCVQGIDSKDFQRESNAFQVIKWSKNKWRRKAFVPEIEITVKVNGEECKLSDISEETLLEIRKMSK